MAGDVEVGVDHPVRAHGVFDHLLAKAPVLQQALLDALAQGLQGDAGVEPPHAHDEHQVGLGVHAQPGGVDPGHALRRCGHVLFFP
jgi:hypothetical protein